MRFLLLSAAVLTTACGGELPEAEPLTFTCRTRCGLRTDVNHCDKLAGMERVATQVLFYIYDIDVCPHIDGILVEFVDPWEQTGIKGRCFAEERRIQVVRDAPAPKRTLSHELIHQLDYDLAVPFNNGPDGHGSWDARFIWPLLQTVGYRELRGEI